MSLVPVDSRFAVAVDGKTFLLGIFGDPVSHSLSPQMQNAALKSLGINAVYVPFHVRPDDLEKAVGSIRALGLRGVNVTVPHKEAVCAYLDQIDEEALRIGAVNTIVNEGGRLLGFNTDGVGFLRSLEQDFGFDARGKEVLLLGAGGAARAALVSLARSGARRIYLANRTKRKARNLLQEMRSYFSRTDFEVVDLSPEGLKPCLRNIDLMVNSTSMGLQGEGWETFPWSAMPERVFVYDMVYSKNGTALTHRASRHGCRCADGLGMLAGQGEEAFFLWTGRRPPSGFMRQSLAS